MTDANLGELERLHAEFVAADAALRDARSRPGFWASPTYHLQRAYEETADAYQHALLRHGPALVAEVRRLRAEQARYTLSPGQADQRKHMAEAAVAALRLEFEDTSPSDITEAIARLRASLPAVGDYTLDDHPEYVVGVRYADDAGEPLPDGVITVTAPGGNGFSCATSDVAYILLCDRQLIGELREAVAELWAENGRLRARVAELGGPQIADGTAAAGGTSGPYRVR